MKLACWLRAAVRWILRSDAWSGPFNFECCRCTDCHRCRYHGAPCVGETPKKLEMEVAGA